MHQTSSFGLDFIKHTAVWKICCMQYLVQILQYIYCHKNLKKKNTDIATDESSLKVLALHWRPERSFDIDKMASKPIELTNKN